MRRILLALVVLTLVVIVALGVRELAEERTRVREFVELRERVYAARVSADSCRNELAYEERRFRRFDEVVDSLRDEVRAFEALDARGVPQEQYDAYMEEFTGYNDSVAAWEERADALRASEAACRSMVRDHNQLSDSLRRRLIAEGIEGAPSP